MNQSDQVASLCFCIPHLKLSHFFEQTLLWFCLHTRVWALINLLLKVNTQAFMQTNCSFRVAWEYFIAALRGHRLLVTIVWYGSVTWESLSAEWVAGVLSKQEGAWMSHLCRRSCQSTFTWAFMKLLGLPLWYVFAEVFGWFCWFFFASAVRFWMTIKSALQLVVEKKHLQCLSRGTWWKEFKWKVNLPGAAASTAGWDELQSGCGKGRPCFLPSCLPWHPYGCSRPHMGGWETEVWEGGIISIFIYFTRIWQILKDSHAHGFETAVQI